MANSLALPTNNTSVVLWFIQVQKQGDKKRKKQKKNMSLSMWLIIGICI
jgi:hypothetical protein